MNKMEKYKYKMEEKYIKRRTVATMLGMQFVTIFYV
jgi:hypothetical protein